MGDHHAETFRVVSTARGARYILPRRAIGAWRMIGLAPICFGLMFGSVPAVMFVGMMMSAGSSQQSSFDPFMLIFVLFLIPFLLLAMAAIRIGILITFGHSEVEITTTHLRAVERAGFIRRAKRRPRERLVRLVVPEPGESALSEARSGAHPTPVKSIVELASDFSLIRAEFDAAKPLYLAIGYPRAMVRELAGRIAEEMEVEQPLAPLVGRSEAQAGTRVPVVVEPYTPSSRIAAPAGGASAVRLRDPVPIEPPRGSSLIVDNTRDGISITIPAAGLWRGSKGLFFMALFWNGLLTIFLIGIFAAMIGGQWGAAIGLLFLIPFIAIGVGLMLGAINMGRRRAVIDIVGDTLLITQKGLFGVKEHEWTRGQLHDIRVGESGMKVNDRSIMELQIVPESGNKVGLLSERNDDDLRWIAGRLVDVLGLPEPSLTATDDDEWNRDEIDAPIEQPAKSDAHLEEHSDGITITIPAAGVWRGSRGLFFFALLWNGFMVIFSGFSVFVPLFQGSFGMHNLPFLLGTLLFGAIGIALLIGAVNMGRRRAVIDVVGDRLLITHKSMFGLKEYEWHRDELEAIRVDNSGMEMNNRPIRNLQIVRREGKKVGLFSQRKDDELEWIAQRVRRALGVRG